MSLAQVSRESLTRYPQNQAYRIPHNFYYDLGLPRFSPRLEQIIALSAITRYRLEDWFAIFGFPLDNISRIQAILANARTTLLDPTVYDKEAWISWFRDREPSAPPSQASIAPLTQLITLDKPKRAALLLPANPSPFLYAKIGYKDALAFPDLLPGSIVRVNSRRTQEFLDPPAGTISNRFFLVEHAKGLVCCRLSPAATNRITLCATELPYAQVELEPEREARVLGALDFELRFVDKSTSPQVPQDLGAFWRPLPLPFNSGRDFGQSILRGRIRAGLSLRAASARTRLVAQVLGDDRYFCAAGALSNYEAARTLPRHIHKTLAICIVYALKFRELLRSAQVHTGDPSYEAIPDTFLHRLEHYDVARISAGSDDTGFLSRLTDQLEEIPLFLRHCLPALCGLPDFSVRNVYWVGGQRNSLHPYFSSALFVVVDPRNKRPVLARTRPLWEQPTYLLLKRDGTYICAGCNLQDGALIVRPFSNGSTRPERLRNKVDVEIVGKIVAVLRKL
ncbi:MAG: hypothetical protein WB630_19100 [Candidatus Acidiferrales bacterium]